MANVMLKSIHHSSYRSTSCCHGLYNSTSSCKSQ